MSDGKRRKERKRERLRGREGGERSETEYTGCSEKIRVDCCIFARIDELVILCDKSVKKFFLARG